jgi:hypothetical protein
VPVELTQWMFEENQPVPWQYVCMLSGGWYLNYRRFLVPPVPHGGLQQQYEICRRRFIILPNLCDDLAFALDSYMWSTLGRWEIDPGRRAGYL